MSVQLPCSSLPDAHLRCRVATYSEAPAFYEPAGLWLYGNVKLLEAQLAYVPQTNGPCTHLPKELDEIEKQTEGIVLDGKVLVCGVHNAAHQRSAVVPLRWGSPRIVVLSGGFKYHLGENLDQEPFRAARLWRFAWDPTTDLAVSRRAPDKKPTFATHNPTVDRLITRLASGERVGILSPLDFSKLYIG